MSYSSEEESLISPSERSPIFVHSDFPEGEEDKDAVLEASPKSANSLYFAKVMIVGVSLLAASGVFMVTYSTISDTRRVTKLTLKLSESNTDTYSDLEDTDKRALFEDFKSKYFKSYESDSVEAARYQNFLSNLESIDSRNADEVTNGGTAVHGINMFADASATELSSLLGYKATESTSARRLAAKMKKGSSPSRKTASSDTLVDWSGVYTTPVKNQGYCGSCWAFSAVEQIESDAIRLGFTSTEEHLAPQQVVSCDRSDFGCDGGNPYSGYTYVELTGGLMKETAYPYTSEDGKDAECSSVKSDYKVTVTDYFFLDTEDEMIDYVTTTGPLSICIAAETWASYLSGVITVCGRTVDHCVQATGYNIENNYWIIRNSWSADWGESGYIYVKGNEDLCNIAAEATYTVVQAVKN